MVWLESLNENVILFKKKNFKKMIYWFKGNLTYGIDLVGDLEDIIVAREKNIITKKAKKQWKYLTDEEVASWRKKLNLNRRNGGFEGEKTNMIYYAMGLRIRRVKDRTLKAFLVKTFGINIGRKNKDKHLRRIGLCQ